MASSPTFTKSYLHQKGILTTEGPKSLRNKVAIVTGSSSGIGQAIAVHFSYEGAQGIILHGRNAEGIKKTKEQILHAGSNTKVCEVVGDLTDEGTQHDLIKAAIDHFGKLDILVNNAGVNGTVANIENSSMSDYDHVMDVNVRAVISLTKIAIPHLVDSKGAVVNISSALAKKPLPISSLYGMSKAAIDHFTKVLALEMGPKGVRVNSVNVGFVPVTAFHTREGNMSQEAMDGLTAGMNKFHSMGRCAELTDIVKAVTFAASEQSSFTTGTSIMCDGGFHIHTPMGH